MKPTSDSPAYMILSKADLAALLARFANTAPDYACLSIDLTVSHDATLTSSAGAVQVRLTNCDGNPVVCDYRNSIEFAHTRTDLHCSVG